VRRFAIIFICALATAPAAVAHAGGNSSVDQYTESVPTAGGGSHHSGGGGNSGSSSIPQSTAQSLDSQGSTGQAAANLAEATAPKRVPSHHKKHAGNSHRDRGSSLAPVAHPGDGPAAGQSIGSDSGGGIGLLLPIFLGASLLAAITVVAVRRRGSGGNPQAS
jgi:hypothetical protein